MITIKNSDLDTLDRRLAVCQSVIWAATSALEEHGDPTDAAALAYSFEELRDEVNKHRKKDEYQPG